PCRASANRRDRDGSGRAGGGRIADRAPRPALVGDRDANQGSCPFLMRDQPTLPIPVGVLALLLGLTVYALAVAWASQWIERLPNLTEAVVYCFLGVVWFLLLRRFPIWRETGRWR